jgi:hypothetical protein
MSNAPVESGLQDMRVEWVPETTPGTPPTDPEWNAYSREIDELTSSMDGQKEATSSLGFRDFIELYRGVEEASVTLNYSQYRFPIDNSGTVVDPIAIPVTRDANADYPSHTIVGRREVSGGGADGAGYREFLVVMGARPVSASFDGDPSAAEALPQELGYDNAEKARPHIIHQPSSSGTLVVRSTDSNDTNSVTIESEGGSTTTDVSLPGSDPNTVATTTDFDDIDSVWVDGEHAGDIMIGTDDGSESIDVELLQKPLTGTNTDGVDSVAGVPPTGSGSHATPTWADQGTIFLGTTNEWADGVLGERVHTLSGSVEHDVSAEAQAETRRPAIDVGVRTVEFDADLAGPYESAEKIKAHFRDKSGDLVWAFGDDPTVDPSNADKKIVAHNAEIIDAPDFTRTAEDTNYIPSVTFQAVGSPAIEIINNS